MSTSPDQDEILATLLEEILNREKEGLQPDFNILTQKHPLLVEELRQLWATSRLTQDLTPFKPAGTAQKTKLVAEKGTTVPAEEQDDLPWEKLPRILGDFKLEAVLGRGGMGVVYKARQMSLGRPVALKMIRRGEGAEPLELARFKAEILAIASLDHPNLVPILEAGMAEGKPFFTMPFVTGPTLAARLASGPLDQRESARILFQVADAIHHAHTHGFLHRDLKPSNILLDNAGNPLVTDFGLSKALPLSGDLLKTPDNHKVDQLTMSGAIVGTPCYIAPELVNRSFGTPSPSSDVYSLGVILYEMLTGRPPFRAPNAVETLLLVLDQEPVRPSLLNPKVNRDLELICLTCIQKQPATRYRSAGDLAEDLASWLEKKPLKVRQGGIFNPGVWISRMLRETHHASVLENWGLLWMWHGAMVFLLCVLTWLMHRNGLDQPTGYLALWGGGLVVWGAIFWKLRTRGGPVLFVERQVAHAWAGSVIAVVSVFFCEILLNLPPLTLSPILPVITGMLFFFKAGTLSGEFYLHSLASFLIVVPMALFPSVNQLLFGLVLGLSFFLPGLKYHRQRLKSLQDEKVFG